MTTRTFFSIAAFLVLAVAGGIYFFPRQDHPAGVRPEQAPAPVPNISGINGAQVYAQSCAKCHGDKGEGSYGPPFTLPSSTSDESLALLVRNGVQGTEMSAHDESEISDAQLVALIQYLKSDILIKTPAQIKQAEIGPNPAKTQIGLALVPVQGGDLIARATLKDGKGAPMVKMPIVFNEVSVLGGRLPLTTTVTNEQGLAILYYPLKDGESVRLEASFEGVRGLAASSATDEVSLPGGTEPESLATGLLSPNPPLGLAVIIVLVLGGVWLTYGYIVSLLLQIASWRDNTSRLLDRR